MLNPFRKTRGPVTDEVLRLRMLVAEGIDRILSGGDVDAELKSMESVFGAAGRNTARDKLANDAVHALRHWNIDDDIRAKDSEYETAQRNGLRRYISQLRGEY